jgi:hypothetical protein
MVLSTLGLDDGKRTTTTFDLVHKRDKSNLVYQKQSKNLHPD